MVNLSRFRLAAFAAHNVLAGKLTGKNGESCKGVYLGSHSVGANKTVILSKPLVFTKANIDKFHF